MKSYTLNYVGSGECSEFFAENDREAAEIAAFRVSGCCFDKNAGRFTEPVVAEQWDAAGLNDDDEPCKRLLIWECEQDAVDNNGSKAIAQVETIGDL